MMSASDLPGGMTSEAAGAAEGAVTESAKGEDSNMKQVWRFIYVDMSFITGLYGILYAAELGLSLLGLICVSVPKNEGCAYLYSSTYSYYEFVASSGFIISLVWYFLYVLAITKKLGFVRWDIAELVSNAFFIFNYLIASSVVAAKACGQGGYSAAAAFGFFCLIAYGVHEYFTVRAFLERRRDTAAGSPAAPDDESKY